ncbi:hypothetical protein Tco_0473100 [Tanacetum coccineum]
MCVCRDKHHHVPQPLLKFLFEDIRRFLDAHGTITVHIESVLSDVLNIPPPRESSAPVYIAMCVSDIESRSTLKMMEDMLLLEGYPKGGKTHRIDPSKTSRENKFVSINKVRASIRTKPITVSQPHVNTKKDVNSDSNGFSSTGVNITASPKGHSLGKRKPEVKKPKKVGSKERLASPTSSEPSITRRWSPNGRMFDCNGKIIKSRASKGQSNGDNPCTSNPHEPSSKRFPNPTCFLGRNLKLLINFVWKFLGTVLFRNDHVAAILEFVNLQWGNILITRVYFVEGLGHNLFSVRQFCDSDLEVAFRRNTCFVSVGKYKLKGQSTAK